MSPPVASEPGYRRPLLVIQADSFNVSEINTVICAVITSNTRLAAAPGNVLLDQSASNLPKTSVINISQLVTIDKKLLTECIGAIPQGVMRKVERGIQIVLDLQES